MRPVLRALTLLFLLPLLYVAVAYCAAILPGKRAELPTGTENLIALVRGPIHYDILIPLRPDTRRHFGFAEAAGVPISLPQAEWLVVGWGARQFYTTAGTFADVSAGAVLRAVVGDAAVIHLEVAGDISLIRDVIYLTLSDAQFTALLAAIDAGFVHDQTGAALALADKFSSHDAFFAGAGSFNLWHTCNAWVGKVLRAAGVPLGRWTPLPQTLSFSLGWHKGSTE